MPSELSISVLAGERPLDATSIDVALMLPSVDLASHGVSIHQPPSEALALQDADLDLRHVEPTRMLWRVMKLHASQQCVGGRAAQHFLEARTEVGVEVVQNQMNLAGRGVGALEQLPYESDEIGRGSALGDLEHSASASGFYGHKHIAGSLADVFVIVFGGRAGLHGERRPAVSDQLLALLVDTDHGFLAAVGPRVQFQHIVHPPSVFLGQGADAPHQLAPGFEEVFFNSRRMLSRLISRIPGWRRAASVSNATVQRLAPGGGEEHAKAGAEDIMDPRSTKVVTIFTDEQ